MKTLTGCLLLLLNATTAQAQCPLDDIFDALTAPLGTMTPLEREVSDRQSTDGGVWQIYRQKNGRVNSIVRLDNGELGAFETRLSIVDRQNYGISTTNVNYLRHAYVGNGPNGVARKITDYFYYCDGRIYLPDSKMVGIDVDAYPKAAVEARKTILDDKDVAEFTRDLAR